MEDALANVAEEGHELDVQGEGQVLHGHVQLGDSEAQGDQGPLQEVRLPAELAEAAAVPEKGGQGDDGEEELQGEPDLGETAVLVDGHHPQVAEEAEVVGFF